MPLSETGAAEPGGRLARLARGPADLAGGVVRALGPAIEDLFRDRCPQYAAAISYHVLFSLFPFTIVLVSIFGLVLQDDEFRARVIDELLNVLPVSESGQQDVQRSIEQIATPLSAIGLVSLVALLWGASGMMAAIRVGVETALKVDRGRPVAHAKLLDLVLVGASGVLVLVVIGISAFAAFFSRVLEQAIEGLGVDAAVLGVLIRDGVQLSLLCVTAVALYWIVPSRKPRPRQVLAGAVLSAVLIWGAAKVLAIVFDFTRYNVIYGSLAGVMTFLVFVYVVALILLFGAEFAYAWSRPPGPPGPPFGVKVRRFLRGLVVHQEPYEPPARGDDASP